MGIIFNESNQQFTLETKTSTYQMQVAKFGHLLHVYYGKKIGNTDVSFLTRGADAGFSGNCYEAYLEDDRTYSLDQYKQEYATFGSADFRSSALAARFANGSQTLELRYVSHKITDGKYSLPGLPAMWDQEHQAQTLEITLRDAYYPLEVTLYYGVFEAYDIITRAAKITNLAEETVTLERALSICVDLQDKEYDFISFYGKHNLERQMERRPVYHGKQVVDSVRGTSSHQQNPFVILCDHQSTEDYGNCYGFSFIYSGNFLAETEVDQYDQTRFVMGIHPTGFSYQLAPGESFVTPEVACVYSGNGFGELSRKLHSAYLNHLCRSKYTKTRRPILINNWEATTFTFDDQKLLSIAKDAKELGIEMLVMDDGWFGKRDDDRSGLGDWFVNTKKLSKGVAGLAKEVTDLGMQFGIWVEPEMVNEDSDLYRAHPDWALSVPGRKGTYSRSQMVLDMGRKEVRDYLFESIGAVLDSAAISYVKWDMNRHLTDVWSGVLPAQSQGEAYHRYVLGLYELLERFVAKYPDVLFEGCSGGGGRFDAGWLYYMPQSWCSDDTDAIERLKIQYGTSFGYPVRAVGAHVSVVPNQQTDRVVSLRTRGVVAMSGTFGYELDITKMTEEEKDIVREQVEDFKKYYDLIQFGDYYRLTGQDEKNPFFAWEFVQKDQKKALLNLVTLRSIPNAPFLTVMAKGLKEDALYRVTIKKEFVQEHASSDEKQELEGKEFALDITASGAALMYAGMPVPRQKGDYRAYQYVVEQIS